MMHVAIDARLPDSGQGGVLQVLRVLGLSFQHESIPEFKRTWIVYRGTKWWRDTVPAGDSILEVDPPFGGVALRVAERLPRLISFAYPLMRRIQKDQPTFDAELQERGVDLVHLPFQDGFLTELPSVYNPHDLQHHYFPENFSESQRRHREVIWRRRADRATTVMAASYSVEDDLNRLWAVERAKIRVVPIPPPARTVPEAPSAICLASLTDFAVYPAVYWPHKNHLRLIEALGILQRRGVLLDLVLTGAEAGNYREVRAAASRLPNPGRVVFAGHVSNVDLSWMIAEARVMIVPSLFEAMSLTVWDGQRLGTAVACSSVVPFPDQVGDSALIFDAYDPANIADVLQTLWEDDNLRAEIVDRASNRVKELTDENFGSAMYGVYCEALGEPIPAASVRAAEYLRTVIGGTPVNE